MDKHLLTSIDPVVIGERLAEARRARGLTQQQAADVIDVARTTLPVASAAGAAELVSYATMRDRLRNRRVTERQDSIRTQEARAVSPPRSSLGPIGDDE